MIRPALNAFVVLATRPDGNCLLGRVDHSLLTMLGNPALIFPILHCHHQPPEADDSPTWRATRYAVWRAMARVRGEIAKAVTDDPTP